MPACPYHLPVRTSTHGDHTVKVFLYVAGVQLRVFKGHPRTPWTVKYHPSDPNILASGCLGCQVRIWNIAQSSCVNMARFEYSIISLSFHPAGSYLAVATGSKLEMWKWSGTSDNLTPRSTDSSPTPKLSRPIVHFRNIRAVVFHPAGEYVFAAAPDQPRPPSDSLTPCRLHSFKFASLFDEFDDSPIELSSIAVLLPEIHLYSDGGLDISLDGKYLLTCAMLYVPPTMSVCVSQSEDRFNKTSSFSPISHTERLDCMDEVAAPAIPLGSGSSIGSFFKAYAERTGALRNNNSPSNLQLPPPLYSSPHAGDGKGRTPRIPTLFFDSGGSEGSNPGFGASLCRSNSTDAIDQSHPLRSKTYVQLHHSSPDRLRSSSLGGLGGNNYVYNPNPNYYNGDVGATPTNNIGNTEELYGSQYLWQSYPASPMVGAPSYSTYIHSPSNSTSTASIFTATLPYRLLSSQESYLSPQPSSNDVFNLPVPGAPLKARSISLNGCADTEHEFTEHPDPAQNGLRLIQPDLLLDKAHVTRNSRAQRKRLLLLHDPRKASSGGLPIGWSSEEHLCLFQLNFEDNVLLPPKLMTTKHLPGSLMKAITSTKLSPTCRYALVGYGVRLDGEVQDHPEKNVACEVVSLLQSTNLKTVATMSDKEDEVNVAQFHPHAGRGIVYGTKKGKVRCFTK
eukprot:gene27954-36820_t